MRRGFAFVRRRFQEFDEFYMPSPYARSTPIPKDPHKKDDLTAHVGRLSDHLNWLDREIEPERVIAIAKQWDRPLKSDPGLFDRYFEGYSFWVYYDGLCYFSPVVFVFNHGLEEPRIYARKFYGIETSRINGRLRERHRPTGTIDARGNLEMSDDELRKLGLSGHAMAMRMAQRWWNLASKLVGKRPHWSAKDIEARTNPTRRRKKRH